ncbi:MBL fold metallo-hydrolase [Bradyrhizobium ontarionense]|uniref:MBL fold metallo-hydrolase n=1 Tax=Bradyrhizobium ontarionense TaxID=2898149 RepID=A0ABY3RGH4_9BRAD|nr:MBL fold metallo-hydrolase [Bradyrhizobium sp. A19]UFZ06418.1 MBL fold metallo-hydrolase [Bradyrhizobium sp. A19]
MLFRGCTCVPWPSTTGRGPFRADEGPVPDCSSGAVDRRDALCGMGAAALWATIGSLIGGARPARAQKLTEAMPEVDSLSIRVITDSFQQVFAAPARIGNVDVQPFSLGLTDKPPRHVLESEWGVSALLQTQSGTEQRSVLVDFGYTPETLMNNMALLQIRPDMLDAMLLTHGHYDHFGGMAGFLGANKGQFRSGVALYLGGEEAFCTREIVVPLTPPQSYNFGALDRNALQNAGVKVVFADRPTLIAGHIVATGPIGQRTFEHVTAPTRMSAGLADGYGCFPEQMPEAKRTAKSIPDDFSLIPCVNVRGRGLVVFTGCGHRGIVNTLRQAIAATGVEKIHAVMGGFHLAPERDGYVQETVAAIKQINPDFVLPMHCTGDLFAKLVEQDMPGKLIRINTGTRVIFRA